MPEEEGSKTGALVKDFSEHFYRLSFPPSPSWDVRGRQLKLEKIRKHQRHVMLLAAYSIKFIVSLSVVNMGPVKQSKQCWFQSDSICKREWKSCCNKDF
ncbi:hypothetical protein CDAR_486901 [Caerostris darwini]|uniref:Uncharacterized protein n=1 Tax=Caerostris darwini TaxID=1538125 RepID=A0AAV4R339_9ARAC|nr:hypothetical protein CDAR_486901 [Caerostris darwini]